MKNTILILITMLFFFSSCTQSNEKKLQKLLLSGSIKPASYRMDDEKNMIEEPEKTDTIEDDVVKDDMYYFNQQLAIAEADCGTCYIIGDYQLCPEKKLIKVLRMFGTAVIDAMGFFPDTTLKYHEETMIIFAGRAFFDKSNLKIDWQTVKLLSYSDHYSEFTDGKTVYYFGYPNVQIKGKYDKNTYKPNVEKKPKKINHPDFRELTDDFHVKGKTFVFGDLSYGDEIEGDPDFNTKEIWKNFAFTPILEPFDVPNLHTIVSASGFETDYITDGKQVLFGGGKTGYETTKRFGKEYVVAKRWMIEGGVDFATLRVLGKDMLADKNAIYYRESVIPFDKLEGFKFILREM